MTLLHEIRRTLTLAWPIMGAQVLALSMTFVDSVMVGRLGVKPLASLAMATGFSNLIFLAVMGLLSALSPLIAEAFGRDRRPEIAVLTGQGLRIAGVAFIVTLVLFALAGDILIAFGQSAELVPDAEAYLMALIWGVPAQYGYVALRQMIEGTGDSRPSLFFAGIAAALNVSFVYALVYGVWGLPALGVAGAGYATSALNWVSFVGLFLYVLRAGRYKDFAPASGLRLWDRRAFGKIMVLGLPLAATLVSEVAFFVASTFLAGTLGALPQAAHQIALNAASFTFMIPFGLSIAVAIRIGQAVGRSDAGTLRQSALAGVSITLVLQSLAALVFLSVPSFIAGIYTEEVELLGVASRLLVIAGIFQLFDGLQVLGMGQMRGIKQTRVPFLVTLVAFWALGAPTGHYLAFGRKLGVDGLWYGLLTGLCVAAVLHQLRFWCVYRRVVTQ